MQEQSLYEYLYESLVSQLECGAYTFGQKLPSQKQLCQQYNVGITTVRKVMKMLHDDKYVHTALGQPAIVTYEASQEAYISALSKRRIEVADAYRGLGLLLPLLYLEGAKRCREPEFRKIQQAIDGIYDDMDLNELYQQANIFFTTLTTTFHNALILDLELDAENFLHVPYLPFSGAEDPYAISAERVKKWLITATDRIANKKFDLFYKSVLQFYQMSSKRVDDYFHSLNPHPTESLQEREIHWFRVKKSPELYTSLAMTILRRIIYREFEGQKYLPSIPKIVEDYGVTKETASRAMGLLNAMGITHTLNKKGTVVKSRYAKSPAASVDFNSPAIRQKLQLCLDSLQIMALTVRNCTTAVSPVSGELFSTIEHKLSTVSSDNISPLSVQLLMACSIQLAPCHSLKNIYQQLNELMSCVYYLQSADSSLHPDSGKMAEAIQNVVAAIKEDPQNSLPLALERAFSQIYKDANAVFSQLLLS